MVQHADAEERQCALQFSRYVAVIAERFTNWKELLEANDLAVKELPMSVSIHFPIEPRVPADMGHFWTMTTLS